MRRALISILLAFSMLSVISCSHTRPSDELMAAFIHAYRAEGIIYSPSIPEGEEGYIDDELYDRIYVHSGEHPDDFSIFLASHTDSHSECGVFNCRDSEMLASVEQMCLERVRLLDPERGFVTRSGLTVFYSTMSERERAQRLWAGIIGR